MDKFFGIYRAVVTDDQDPQQMRRLRVRVPELLDHEISSWANACVPADSSRQPEVGSGVWVMFEGGDPVRPVWIGVVVARQFTLGLATAKWRRRRDFGRRSIGSTRLRKELLKRD